MPAIIEKTIKTIAPDFPPDELLISEDGVPLESDWHVSEIGLLRDVIHQHLVGRRDFFAGGNMFLYFNEEQARNKDYRGPDFFFVWGVSPTPVRPYWAVWKEGGRYPNLIIELLSPSTAHEDLTTKKEIYEKTFRTPEYYCYDPDSRELQGWHLKQDTYQPLVANDKGQLWSDQLKLWLGLWDGAYQNRDATWLRFYTPEMDLVPTANEHADVRVIDERRRAEAAEAEVARLKAQLAVKKD